MTMDSGELTFFGKIVDLIDNEAMVAWCRLNQFCQRTHQIPHKIGCLPRPRIGQLTVSEPLATTLRDGAVVHGVLWMHVSKLRDFEVEYDGRRHSDYRNDYAHERHIRAMAKVILAEMVENLTQQSQSDGGNESSPAMSAMHR